MAKAKLKHYYKPTPVRLRKLGDAILGASIFVATTWSFVLQERPVWAVAIMVVGAAGKFLTNFFKDETAQNTNQLQPGPDSDAGA